jgi:hypothetical protein
VDCGAGLGFDYVDPAFGGASDYVVAEGCEDGYACRVFGVLRCLFRGYSRVDFFAVWGLRSEGSGGEDSFDWFCAGDVYQYWLVFKEGGDEKEAGE